MFKDNFHTEFTDKYVDEYEINLSNSSINLLVPFEEQGEYFYKTFKTESFDISLISNGLNLMTVGQDYDQMVEYMWDTTPFLRDLYLYFRNYVEASK